MSNEEKLEERVHKLEKKVKELETRLEKLEEKPRIEEKARRDASGIY